MKYLLKFIKIFTVIYAALLPNIAVSQIGLGSMGVGDPIISALKDKNTKVSKSVKKIKSNITNQDQKNEITKATSDGGKTIIIGDEYAKKIKANDRSNKKSLMFLDKDLKKINQAIEAYLGNKIFEGGNETKEPKEEVVELEKKEINSPREQSRIYLDAILYISKERWVAWMNGAKIAKDSNDSGNSLYITQINSQSLKIRWSMGMSKWKALTGKNVLDKGTFLNPKTNEIEINFSLEANQTFNLDGNKITEGKFKDINAEQNTADAT